jgi:hypothetical protein
MTKRELAALDAYLDAPHGSQEARDALADLIELADKKRR